MGFVGYLIGITILLTLPMGAVAQYEYRIGKGQASIEPDKNIFSLSLAGYGVPKEGRFSVEWKTRANLGSVVDATVLGGRLYALQQGSLIRMELNNQSGEKKILQQSAPLKLLAGNENTLFALNTDNELLEAGTLPPGGLKWKRKAVLTQRPLALGYWKGRFVVLDTAGMIWTASDQPGLLSWEAMLVCKGAIDIMADKENLYVLTDQQEILRYQESTGWIRVAIHNEFTYKQKLRLVLSSSLGYWALDSTGVLYRGAHNSNGQLSVGAMVIQKGKDRVAIVGTDLCGFNTNFITEVKLKIQQTFGIPPSAVMINASHTHFAPVTQDWLTWAPHGQKPDSAYLLVVRAGIMDALRQAMKSLRPANLYFGKLEVEIGKNRSLREQDSPYDKALDVIRVDYKHLAEDDILFSVGCHPVAQHTGKEGITISPNYPGVARELLLQQSKIRSAMFIQGSGGDIDPIDKDHQVTGNKVASAVMEIINRGNMQKIEGRIDFSYHTVAFDTKPLPEPQLKEFRAINAGSEGDIVADKNVRWADLMLRYHSTGAMPATMSVYIQSFNVGNWKLIGISREATTEYSLGIKALWPDKLVTVAGYSNDVSSYLPTKRHIKAVTYEGYDSFFWYGQPNVFPEDIYETIISYIKSLMP